jgi:hypothetical protein
VDGSYRSGRDSPIGGGRAGSRLALDGLNQKYRFGSDQR